MWTALAADAEGEEEGEQMADEKESTSVLPSNPRNHSSTSATTTSSAVLSGVEENFSLLPGNNPLAFGMMIRLVPELVEEIRKVEDQGGTPKIKFGSIGTNPSENVETAYDMLLMRSLTQRRAGKVVDSGIRYADFKRVNGLGMGSLPKWLQGSVKSAPLSMETPSTSDLGIQAGVYGALMVLTYVNGASMPYEAPYAGADIPGLLLATSFGDSLHFMTKKNVKLGNALTFVH